MAIRLVSASAVDDNLEIDNGELTIVYRPRELTRRAKRQLADAIDAVRAFSDKQRKSKRSSEDDEETFLRLLCNVIGLMVTSDESNPNAGDLLFRGWAEDEKIADHQIISLYATLLGIDLDDAEDDGSPS